MATPKDCDGKVNKEYFAHAVHASNIVIIVYYVERTRRTLLGGGFIIGQINTPALFIDIICAPPKVRGRELHGGALLLRIADEFVLSHPQLKEIYLNALPGVLAYYPKFDYEHRHACKPGEEVIRMTPEEKKQFMTNLDLYKNEATLGYMHKLQQNRFMKYIPGDDAPECDSPALTKKDMQELRCGIDGFTMRKCFAGPGDSDATHPPSSASSVHAPHRAPSVESVTATRTTRTARPARSSAIRRAAAKEAEPSSRNKKPRAAGGKTKQPKQSKA